ncbi:MAG: SEC-C metal-binding domain-containing protein, partial [Planctomycetota bacterium]
WVKKTFDVEISTEAADSAVSPDNPSIDATMAAITERYDARRADWGDKLTERIESYLVLTAIDQKWKDHLHAMDALKAGIGLRGYGQQDPKIAYKKEATELFGDNLLPAIESDVSSKILRIEVGQPEDERPAQAAGAAEDQLAPRGIGQGAQAAGAAPQGEPKKIQFDELSEEQQLQFLHQMDPNQRLTLMARMPRDMGEPLSSKLSEEAHEQHLAFVGGLDANQQISLITQMPTAIQSNLLENLSEESTTSHQEFVKGLDANQQLTLLVQIPEVLRDRITPALDGEIVEKLPEAQKQFEAFKVQQAQQKQAQAEQMRGPAASNAFDVMKRQKALEEARRRAEAAAQESGGASAGAPAQAKGTAAGSTPSRAASTRTVSAQALGPEFKNATRNDPCPCGSGKKFKKCHGK